METRKKDIERLEIIKDVLQKVIVNSVSVEENRTTSAVKMQALAEVVRVFCQVVEMGKSINLFGFE